jgi:VCBS repeat-containing protein
MSFYHPRIVCTAIATLALALLLIAPSDYAAAAPVLGGQLYGTGGTVTVEVLPADANDTSELRLCSPGQERLIATNREVGRVVNLGSFPSGEELIFCIVNLVHGDKFFMGPASRNPDGIEHAVVDQIGPTTAIVGFEDVFGGYDRDFNDNRFEFSGVVPEPNRSPAAADDEYSTPEDTTLTLPASGVLANDSDPDGDSLTATLVAGPAHGTVTLTPDGSFAYVPAANYQGEDSFTYEANDAELDSNEATVTIDVESLNDPPVAADDEYSTPEDTPLNVPSSGVLANDSDPDGDSLTATLVAEPSHGAVTLEPDGSFTYQPVANYSGPDGFTYTASDGVLGSNTTTVNITVQSINDPPECNSVLVNVASLWPADHKLVLLSVNGGTDSEGGPVVLAIGAVTQDEPVDGLGDGDTAPDAVLGQQSNEVLLRAERSGKGDGRVYTVSYSVSDSGGGTCSGSVTVAVPHSRGQGSNVVDSGQNFNSFSGQ